MTHSTSGIVYVHEYGMTDIQQTWWRAANSDQRDTFLCSAPIRVACQGAAFEDGTSGHIYVGVIHGVPVGKAFLRDPLQAYADALEIQDQARENLAGRVVQLDLDALEIRGEDVDEYATPEGRFAAFFQEAKLALAEMTSGEPVPSGQA
ncbi:hypothetical protein GO986_08875 [Deinococcus sp. HMF7620]|uniref:Uncharacterized protein n=1 Tax=Deinococcus arboris TaxID=2682977 RepID=A0A7C9LN51_9DEIO|nr:hypothetical protein [Deinococcus arboris]MVN86876.1 hypothetical protein [Deinococcus arboris]